MATISELLVNIKVKSDSLKVGLSKATRGVNKFSTNSRRRIRKLSGSFDKLGKSIFSVKSGIAALGVGAVFAGLINKGREFEASLADLSAITGAVGKDLKFLSDASKEFGLTTTLSASQAAEAFKLIASAKPDLLTNLPALKAVTKEAIALAEASGTALPEAAKALGGALNQFGAGADQASRFVNVMAAGARLGSSLVEEVAASLNKAGLVAAQTGLSFEETNAALQAMGKDSIKAEIAGTGLRIILSKLEKQADDKLKPSIVGLVTALGNLAKENLNAAQQGKLFGDEAAAAAISLIKNRDVIKTLTGAITGTSEAYEQAKIKAEGFDGKMKALNSAIEGFVLEVFNALKPAITLVIEGFTEATRWATQNKEAFKQLAKVVIAGGALVAGLLAVGIAAKGIAIALSGLAAAIKGVMIAFTLLAAHPIVAAIGIIILAVTALAIKFEGFRQVLIAVRDTAAEVFGFIARSAQTAVQKVGGLLDKITGIQDTAGKLRAKAVDLLPGMDFDPNAPTPKLSQEFLSKAGTAQNRQKVDVNITVDKDTIVKTVVGHEIFQDAVNSFTDRATKDAARATRR